jgi:TrmH family RNA methyltransferase
VRRVNARQVTSLTNPTVKAARALHMKKARDESGLFLAEGLKLVADAVDLGHAPKVLLHGADARALPAFRAVADAAARAGGDVIEVSQAILEKVSRRDNPQAVVGVFAQRRAALAELDPAAAPTWVALEGVRDPGNLGTIVRTVDAAGGGGVILIGETCDPYSVEAVRATMGSIFAIPIYRASAEAFTTWRKGWPGSVVGTLLSADMDYRTASYSRPCVILMGPEQAGLSPSLAALCDTVVKIPMRGRADSLNLAVATGIMLYAATG